MTGSLDAICQWLRHELTCKHHVKTNSMWLSPAAVCPSHRHCVLRFCFRGSCACFLSSLVRLRLWFSTCICELSHLLCLAFSRQLPIGHVFSTDGSRCQAPQVSNQGGCRCLSVLITSCSARFGRTGALGCGGSASGLTLTIGTGSLT